MEKNIELPPMHRAAEVGTFDPDSNTVELVWTTGASVRRYDWWKGEYYDETLVVEDGAVRLGRLNGGAPFLNTHGSYDLGDVIGSVVDGSARVEGGKGYATVRLSRREEVQGIVQDIRDGVIRNISVGYRIHKVEKTEADDGSVAQWRVVDWEPLEISAVPIPADPGSQFRSEPPPEPRGARHPCVVVTRDETPADPAITTEDDHMSDKTTAGEERGATTEQFQIDPGVAARAAQEAADAAIRAERERMSAIVTLSSKHGLRALGDEHVGKGTGIEEFRALLLDEIAKRDEQRDQSGTGGRVPPVSGIVVGVEDSEKRAAAIESALLHRSDPGAFELSDAGREFRGMSLLEIARDVLEARGIRTRGKSRLDLAGLALEQRSGSGGMMGTSDFPGILANVLNKTLRQGYQYANQTFRPLVRVVTVPDFKAVSRVLLGEAPSFDQVSEHGEFKRGGMNESKESYAISTFGKIVGITRQVIINDDLSAFTRVPRAFGVQAAQLESDLVWSQILSNPTMLQDNKALFHSDHGNLVAAAAISVTSVGAGRTSMAKQTGLDGKTVLNLDPSYLIVPKALQTKAEQFVGQIFPTQNDNVVPESMRRLQVIAEPRLDNGISARDGIAEAAGSASNWYLSADVSQIDIVELAYLEGAQGVYTETRMGFDTDGVEVKVRLDVGAKAIDFRGLYKNGS